MERKWGKIKNQITRERKAVETEMENNWYFVQNRAEPKGEESWEG